MSMNPEKLYKLLSSQDFLQMKGLSGEVPIFIQTYEVAEEDRVVSLVNGLASRLNASGVQVARIDLFQLLLGELEEEDLLDVIMAEEATWDRVDTLSTLKNYCDPKSRIVPRLVKATDAEGVQLTFITGVGHIFPFLRSHYILESLQPAMMNHPVILFFPGTYNQVEGLGSKLELFGTLPAKRYYRAFNLDHISI